MAKRRRRSDKKGRSTKKKQQLRKQQQKKKQQKRLHQKTHEAKRKQQRKQARKRKEVNAAGGIIVRRTKKGPKVLLVHRPRYRDWTFPKGKLDPGETFKEAALREVEEETGFVCRTHRPRVPSLKYVDGSGRNKEVRYWLMSIKKGEFAPNSEVDMIQWVKPHKVEERLSYRRDRRMYRDVLKSGQIDTVV